MGIRGILPKDHKLPNYLPGHPHRDNFRGGHTSLAGAPQTPQTVGKIYSNEDSVHDIIRFKKKKKITVQNTHLRQNETGGWGVSGGHAGGGVENSSFFFFQILYNAVAVLFL